MWEKSVLNLIGHTPLVKINSLNPNSIVNIFAKLEFFNPSGSIKDRIAKYIIEEAENSGELLPGDTIVENTSGNTGLGLAMVGALKGYKVILTMPDKVSVEKINLPKRYGAEVVVCPTEVPPDSPESYYEVAKKIHHKTPDSFYVNQYNNPKNIEAHYRTTGPEIWNQTNGQVDIVVIGAGTGGTISGVGKYLKDKNSEVKEIGVDPFGSVFTEYFKTGKMIKPHVYKMEGIGEDMLVKALDFKVIDDFIQINDENAFKTARELVKEEGIFAGGSSGAAMWVAQQVARQQKEFKKIVVIFPDSGFRYLSKFYNDKWMKDNGFIN